MLRDGRRAVWALVGLVAIVVASTAGRSASSVAPPEPTGDGFIAFEPPVGEGVTWYVSGRGDDTNSGRSADAALRTLQRAADLTGPGDTVLVMNGTYSRPGTDGVIVSIERSGDPDQWITYKAHPGHEPRVLVGSHWGGIVVAGASYVIIDGFTVQGRAPVISLREARRAQFDTNNSATSGSCIQVRAQLDTGEAPHHVIVRNNKASDCPGGGIESVGADYLRFEDNTVHGNGFYSPYANSGISTYQNSNIDDSSAVKIIIRGNVSYGNENRIPNIFVGEVTDGNGIIVDDGRNLQKTPPGPAYRGSVLIEDNLVFDNGGRGIVTFLSDRITIRGNTLCRNARADAPFFDEDLLVNDSSRVELADNIIVPLPQRRTVTVHNSAQVTLRSNLFVGGAGNPEQEPSELTADPRIPRGCR